MLETDADYFKYLDQSFKNFTDTRQELVGERNFAVAGIMLFVLLTPKNEVGWRNLMKNMII